LFRAPSEYSAISAPSRLAAARWNSKHVEQVAVVGDVAAEPAGGGEGQVGDAVPGRQADELAGTVADLLLGGGRQVRRLGERLAHAPSVVVTTVTGWFGAAVVIAASRLGRSESMMLAIVLFGQQ
jgi:hypothetical protein